MRPEPDLWRFPPACIAPTAIVRYSATHSGMFSFNSAVGACPTCRGFGRVIGVDWGLVIPNDKLTLRGGAIKTDPDAAWSECQDDLMRHAERSGHPARHALVQAYARAAALGDPRRPGLEGQWSKQWYGVKRFFEYLESKAYKMHIRVLLSKYRSYTPCPTCDGARLQDRKPAVAHGQQGGCRCGAATRPALFCPHGVRWSREQLEACPA
jgi:excinuclease ABC subunit A